MACLLVVVATLSVITLSRLTNRNKSSNHHRKSPVLSVVRVTLLSVSLAMASSSLRVITTLSVSLLSISRRLLAAVKCASIHCWWRRKPPKAPKSSVLTENVTTFKNKHKKRRSMSAVFIGFPFTASAQQNRGSLGKPFYLRS